MIFRYVLVFLLTYLIVNHFVAMIYSARSFTWFFRVLTMCFSLLFLYILYSIDKKLSFPIAWLSAFCFEMYAGGYLLYKELNK